MNTLNQNIGKKVSLYEMLNDKNDVVECILIPKIQRDYAQGRIGKEDLRTRFLNSIFDVITSVGSDELVLDFVFGQKESDYKTPFYPVDGQQRLTTLYLLTLYVGKRLGDLIGDELELFKNRFRYQTRDSSEQFCTKHLFEIPNDKWDNVVEYIRDQWWYTDLWKSDPTISSMVRMLEDIDRKCKGFSKEMFLTMWNGLKNKVKFWRLYIKDLKIDSTEELYIKMNSRGKPLSDFEHFKAQIEQYLDNDGNYQPGEFSKNIDTTWTRLFWGYRESENDFEFDKEAGNKIYSDNGLEKKMLKFFHNYLAMIAVKNDILPFSLKENDKVLTTLEAASRILPSKVHVLDEIEVILNFFTRNSKDGKMYSYFSRYLTTQSEEERFAKNGPDDYKVNINVIDGVGSNIDLFEQMMTGNFTIRQALMMEAFFTHILIAEGSDAELNQYIYPPKPLTDSEFLDRLRILRNLMANAHLQDNDDGTHKQELTNAMYTVRQLISFGFNPESNDKFTKEQKQKELDKLMMMRSGNVTPLLLKQLENHWLLRGNLSQLEPLSDEKLRRFREIFTANRKIADRNERLLLAYGDYSVKSDRGVCSFGGTKDPKFWVRYIFQNSNKDSKPIFDTMLKENVDPDKKINDFISQCEKDKYFDWRYYMSKYEEVRLPYQGQYRLELKKRYSYLMCNASGNGYGGEHCWNPYNHVVFSRFDPSQISEDKYGGPLRLIEYNYEFDIAERTIDFGDSEHRYSIAIPENEGVDSVNRIEFGYGILTRLLTAFKAGEPIETIHPDIKSIELTTKSEPTLFDNLDLVL